LLVVFAGCVAQVFLAAADRMHTAQAGPAAARDAARAAVADAKQAVDDAKAKADKAEADARAARKLPPTAPSKKASAGSWCDAGCLQRWDAEATAARQRATDAADALTAARGKAVSDAKLAPAVWLLPACIDAAGIVLWSLVPVLPWPRRKTKPAKAKARRKTAPKPRPTKPTAALRAAGFKPRVVTS